MAIEKKTFDTRIGMIDPRELVLLEQNARFMRHEQFARLVENVKRDKALTSVPLAALMDDGRYEVLSGNHRTAAAIEAGLTEISVMFIDEVLPEQQRRAIQLAHNAIAGEDDPAILQAIYEDLDDIDWREYSGLDDKALGLLKDVQIGSLSEVNLEFQLLSITFLPEELERVKGVIEYAMAAAKTANAAWIARYSQHERLLSAFADVSKSYDVSNVATALDVILDVFEANIGDITDGWWDELEEKLRHTKHVPLGPVTGLYAPAEDAAIVRKAIEKARAGDSSYGAAKALADVCRAYLSEA